MDKDQWLSDCRKKLESVASIINIRGTDKNKAINGMVGGAHVRGMLNNPNTAYLKKTDAWMRILKMPEREKTGVGRSTRYYWPKELVIEICMEELSALYEKEHGIPKQDTFGEFNGRYLNKDHIRQRMMNVSFPKEFVDRFDEACRKLGINRRALVEPELLKIIQKARESGFTDDKKTIRVKKDIDTSLRSMSFMIDEELITKFDLACVKLGVSRRKAIEPEVLRIIEQAKR